MADSPISQLFDLAARDMVQVANTRSGTPEGQVAGEMGRVFKVFVQQVDNGGPDALKAMLDNPAELQRRNIDPAFAGEMKTFLDRHGAAAAPSQGMADDLRGTINREATAQGQRMLGAAAGHAAPPPRQAPPPAAPPPAQQAHTAPPSPPPAPPGGDGSGSAAATPAGGSGPKKPFSLAAKKGIIGVAATALLGGLFWGKGAYDDHVKQAASDKILKKHDYPDVREITGKSGTIRLAVDEALGTSGLVGKMISGGARDFAAKTGLSPLQINDLSVSIRDEKLKDAFYAELGKGNAARVTFVQAGANRYELIPPGQEVTDKYRNKPTVAVTLSAADVSVTANDPASGKGPQTVSYPHEPEVAAKFDLNPVTRQQKLDAAYAANAQAAAAATAKGKSTSGPKGP